MMQTRFVPITIYMSSAVVFLGVADPDIWADYLRGAALAGLAAVVWLIFEVACRYHRRYRCLPVDRRGRMMRPLFVWAMGVSYLAALTPAVKTVVELLGEDIRLYSVPPLALSVLLGFVWLIPLRRHQIRMGRQEAGVA